MYAGVNVILKSNTDQLKNKHTQIKLICISGYAFSTVSIKCLIRTDAVLLKASHQQHSSQPNHMKLNKQIK